MRDHADFARRGKDPLAHSGVRRFSRVDQGPSRNGADVSARDNGGLTALTLATGNAHNGSVDLLLQHVAKQ